MKAVHVVVFLVLAGCGSGATAPDDGGGGGGGDGAAQDSAARDAMVARDAGEPDTGPRADAGDPRDSGGGRDSGGPTPPSCEQMAPPGGVPGTGEVRVVKFYSENMRGDWAFEIYLPPNYPNNGPYPVIYFFHGSYRRPSGVIGGNPLMPADGSTPRRPPRTDFDRAINDGVVPPFIFVAPQAGWDGRQQGCFRDRTDLPMGRLGESYIVDELIPYVDENFDTIAGCLGRPAARSIEGFSMGSGEAQRHAFEYLDLYSSVVAYGNGLVDEDHCGPAVPFDQVANMKASEIAASGLRIRLVSGDQDPLLRSNNRYRRQLRSLGIPFEYEEVPGIGHSYRDLIDADGGRVGQRSLMFHAASWTY